MNKTQSIKKILMLTSRHSAFDGRIFHLEAKTLQEAGYEVAIAAPRINEEPKEADGIRIITFNKPLSGPRRKLATLQSLIDIAMRYKADVLHVHEMDAPLVAAAIVKHRLKKRGRNIKLIFDSHEVWPFFYAARTEFGPFREVIKHAIMGFEDWMLRSSVDAVITAHKIEENYYRWLNPWIPVYKVLNSPPIESWGEIPRRKGPISILGHDGYFSRQRGMDTILGAFERIAPEFPEVRLLAAGAFHHVSDKAWFEQWCQRTGLGERVELAGWVDRKDILGYLDRMDIGIVANRPDIHSVRCWPANKMMYYLGRGLPVVSTPAPLYRLYVEREKCGIATGDFKPESMANALRWMVSNPEEAREMGRKGYQAAIRDFSWEQARKSLLACYGELETAQGNPHTIKRRSS